MRTALEDLHRRHKPFEDMEVQLVSHVLKDRTWLQPLEADVLRYALNLARLYVVGAPGGEGEAVEVSHWLTEFRERIQLTLGPLLGPRIDKKKKLEIKLLIGPIENVVREQIRDLVEKLGGERVREPIADVVTRKDLVLAIGGGGGVGYSCLGAFKAFEERRIKPALIAATSMGAALSLFRCQSDSFRLDELRRVMAGLSYASLLTGGPAQPVFSVPAPLKLMLRETLMYHFKNESGSPLRLKDLKIQLLVAVAGMRQTLPRADDEYGNLMGVPDADGLFRVEALTDKLFRWLEVMMEFLSDPSRFAELNLGLDRDSLEVEGLDAVGFSSSVPGMLQYDLFREDPAALALWKGLLEKEKLVRLVDGGLANNVPVALAWEGVHSGKTARRNAVIVSIDSFAPQLTRNSMWVPLQAIVHNNVKRNLAYGHVHHESKYVLSPFAILPTAEQMETVIRNSYTEFQKTMPLIEALLKPIQFVP